jgi:NAD(P)-dependent dehydrogenase (short-subunit alcohol dehydrogenase family)
VNVGAQLMHGRSGLVTAAGSGIGRASALMFARTGASVIVSDIDEAAGAETMRLIVEGGGVASFVRADVSDEAAVEALVSAVVERYGRLDWAHNNAALGTRAMPLAAMKRSAWDRCLAVTLTGTMLCLKYEIAQMLKQGTGGAIVNTASLSGLTGTPNQSAYVAAKFGVIGLTKTAAIENAAQGIRVNAICPGATNTPAVAAWQVGDPAGYGAALSAIPAGTMASPDDQARTAVWLCSPWAAHITGVSLPVDGGETAGH